MFKSLARQIGPSIVTKCCIGHSVDNGSPPLQHFFKRSCVVWAQWRGNGPRQLVTRFGVMQLV